MPEEKAQAAETSARRNRLDLRQRVTRTRMGDLRRIRRINRSDLLLDRVHLPKRGLNLITAGHLKHPLQGRQVPDLLKLLLESLPMKSEKIDDFRLGHEVRVRRQLLRVFLRLDQPDRRQIAILEEV